jgi:hypothetical protein
MSGSNAPNVSPLRTRLAEAEPRRPRRGGEDFVPDDCPIIPLGTNDGTLWFLDVVGQVRAVQAAKLSKLTLHNLFAPRGDWLLKAAEKKPEWAKTIKARGDAEIVVDFKPDAVARDLMNACAAEGVFNPLGRVRGTGTHRGADDDLVQHFGDVIVAGHTTMRPGRIGDYVYPTAAPRPRPAQEFQPGGSAGPAGELWDLLGRWNWERPELDRRLMLGWIVASFYAGALDWRPHGWATGPRAAGKSTLFRAVGMILHEPAGCVRTGDATSAGVRAVLGHACLPVLFDDAEAEETPERVKSLVQLLRAASTGSLMLRGTAEHGSATFTVRFMGIMNSILRPALKAQDLSRLMLLSLKPLAADAPPLVLKPSELALLGRRLFRRMMDGWHRFNDELPRWHHALKQAGLSDRAPEQFGILLAAADIALHDEPATSEELAEWAMRVAEGTASDRAEELAEWQRCLERIVSTNVQGRRGGQENIGTLIATAAYAPIHTDPETGVVREAPPDERAAAQKLLAQYGLRVVLQHPEGDDAAARALPLRRHKTRPAEFEPAVDQGGRAIGWLAVANGHQALNSSVFRGSHYAAASGTSGGWKAALETAPEALRSKEMRFGGVLSRCVLVPLDHVLDGGDRFGALVE